MATGEGGNVDDDKATVMETEAERQLSGVDLKKECLSYARQHFLIRSRSFSGLGRYSRPICPFSLDPPFI
jgi:hypothetical protein